MPRKGWPFSAMTGPSVTIQTTAIEVVGGEILLDYDYIFCPSPLTVIVQPYQILRVTYAGGNLVTTETFIEDCP